MTYTETRTTGYFSRLGNSIKGIFIGIIFIVISISFLWWNEGRTIKMTEGLNEGKAITVEGNINKIDTSLEGKPIHINGKADTSEILKDEIFLIEKNSIKLIRKVEMFQWKESEKSTTKDNLGGSETTTTTYTYKKDWDTEKIDSSDFKENGHNNSTNWIFNSEIKTAEDVKIGSIKLLSHFVSKIDKEEIISLNQSYIDRINLHLENSKIKLENNSIYITSLSGSINNPEIGDLKITFYAVYSDEVSVIGKQEGNLLNSYFTSNGTEISLLEYGKVSIEGMYQKSQNENKILAWLIRGVGLLFIFIGFNMLFGVLVILAKIIPFLSNIIGIGVGLLSFILTLIVGGGTIIIAWFYVRPIMSIGFIIIIGLIIYGIMNYKKRNIN